MRVLKTRKFIILTLVFAFILIIQSSCEKSKKDSKRYIISGQLFGMNSENPVSNRYLQAVFIGESQHNSFKKISETTTDNNGYFELEYSEILSSDGLGITIIQDYNVCDTMAPIIMKGISPNKDVLIDLSSHPKNKISINIIELNSPFDTLYLYGDLYLDLPNVMITENDISSEVYYILSKNLNENNKEIINQYISLNNFENSFPNKPSLMVYSSTRLKQIRKFYSATFSQSLVESYVDSINYFDVEAVLTPSVNELKIKLE